MVALSVLGIIGSRAKSRSLLLIVRRSVVALGVLGATLTVVVALRQYVVGLGGCLVALLVCSVSAFSFSDKLASTYNAHASSTLACDIGLSGCSNCTDVASEMLPCEGVVHTNADYWVSCNATSSGSGSISSDSGCIEGMTVLNAEADQGYEQNDVRGRRSEVVGLASGVLTRSWSSNALDRNMRQVSGVVRRRRAGVPSQYASPARPLGRGRVPIHGRRVYRRLGPETKPRRIPDRLHLAHTQLCSRFAKAGGHQYETNSKLIISLPHAPRPSVLACRRWGCTASSTSRALRAGPSVAGSPRPRRRGPRRQPEPRTLLPPRCRARAARTARASERTRAGSSRRT